MKGSGLIEGYNLAVAMLAEKFQQFFSFFCVYDFQIQSSLRLTMLTLTFSVQTLSCNMVGLHHHK